MSVICDMNKVEGGGIFKYVGILKSGRYWFIL
jgi:hypothetical protein